MNCTIQQICIYNTGICKQCMECNLTGSCRDIVYHHCCLETSDKVCPEIGVILHSGVERSIWIAFSPMRTGDPQSAHVTSRLKKLDVDTNVVA